MCRRGAAEWMIGMAIVVTGIKTGIGDPKDAALQEALRD